ncbi:hypothetical protein MMC19_007614 [Ptychographa xylographoides]|nr:hypothetical protein [Ptychographa xylographoides]
MAVILASPRGVLNRLQYSWIPVRYATSSASAVHIPPESPKFIDVPQAPQEDACGKPYVKGVLPLPRQIFRPGKPSKAADNYIAAVTPEPTTSKTYNSPAAKALADWKSRQAVVRRRNLREGLVELHQRKVRSDRQLAARSAYKQAEHKRRIREPEREDERLTNPSIIQALKPERVHSLPDPGREARVAQKKARFETKEAKKMEDRRIALHSLYMNARDFIVSEEALNAKVDEVFDDPWFKNNPEHSIWDREGFPDTVVNMLSDANKSRSGSAGYAQTTKDRLQRIAEEFTGGKMS